MGTDLKERRTSTDLFLLCCISSTWHLVGTHQPSAELMKEGSMKTAGRGTHGGWFQGSLSGGCYLKWQLPSANEVQENHRIPQAEQRWPYHPQKLILETRGDHENTPHKDFQVSRDLFPQDAEWEFTHILPEPSGEEWPQLAFGLWSQSVRASVFKSLGYNDPTWWYLGLFYKKQSYSLFMMPWACLNIISCVFSVLFSWKF